MNKTGNPPRPFGVGEEDQEKDEMMFATPLRPGLSLMGDTEQRVCQWEWLFQLCTAQAQGVANYSENCQGPCLESFIAQPVGP